MSFEEQLNKLRLQAGVPIKAEHGKPRQNRAQLNEQPDDAQAAEIDAKTQKVIDGVKQIIAACEEDRQEAGNDPDVAEVCQKDKSSWQRVLQAVYQGNQQRAQQMVQQMDTAGRDYIDIIRSKGKKKAVADYLGLELLKEQDEDNRQHSADDTDGEHSGDNWTSYVVYYVDSGGGSGTTNVAARNASQAQRKAQQQIPDGAHIKGRPEKLGEQQVAEDHRVRKSVRKSNSKHNKKGDRTTTGRKPSSGEGEPEGDSEQEKRREINQLQGRQRADETEQYPQTYTVKFGSFGQAKTAHESLSDRTNKGLKVARLGSMTKDNAFEVTVNNQEGYQRLSNIVKNYRGEIKQQTNEAPQYYTDMYPSHEEDDDAPQNTVDYDGSDGMQASTNSPEYAKSEVPQQTDNRGEQSSTDQDTNVKVPNDIIQELKDVIQQFYDEAERLEQRSGATARDNRKFYQDTAEAFEDILGYLQMDNIEGIKQAQIYASKLMGPMLHKLPTNTWKFIQRGGPNRSLRSYMGKVSDDFPMTGPRNELDDNNWE